MIEITDSLDPEVWDEFVYEHPHGNIFQTSSMANVYRQAKNYVPLSLAAIDPGNGEVLAILQASIISELSGIAGSFTGRSVIIGGPLVKDGKRGNEALSLLLKEYNSSVKSKVVYSQMRNIRDTSEIKETILSYGYEYDQHLDFLIDLDRDEAEIWSDISKSRRKGVNRAEKSGIIIQKVKNDAELQASYDLIHQTYLNVKMPVADFSLFKAIYDEFVPKDMADFFIALQNDIPVGARITLNYKDLVYDWYAGSLADVPYVDEALVWKILSENAGKYKVFDFGGAGHPDKPYGVREFKRRFGGEQVNYGRYKKVHGKVRGKMAEVGYGVYRGLK
ncbi:lipid II:glycine glycyltransferase FemX [Methanococcoides burtonii]|uniref:BioF2-like acetyltransferase domain-containing protein n=1 Tax=Methanococcoides burtonii (strain DSM 6242 / NBRC 107633 / OCM 468 / ACE-M) TaxID=259564 RepID=Q12XZ2_METBU|nr:peptidoglycan bridge formation glycyltransferase FemA/FemB family protein [Methanococcoides burtonii]ABE51684.1 Hypothetical protein Mbur_0719 [Methanococcoides burtonii DSM 6242]